MSAARPPGWRWPGPLAAATAGSALLAALAAFGLLPRAWCGPLAAPLLLFGWARPLLLRWAPPEPAPLKLWCFSLALSPWIGCSVWLLLRLLLPSGEAGLERALGLSLALGAPWQWIGPQRPAPGPGAGPSGRLAALAALLLALAVLALGLSGNALRCSHHGLLHSALALASDRGLPPGNPWMAGAPLAYYWAWHVFGAFLARLLWVAPTLAFAWQNAWALGLATLATWLLAAPLLQRARAEFLALFLALAGLNLWGGYGLLAGGPWPAAPADAGELLASLRQGLVGGPEGAPRFDPRLALALSKFGNPSSYPAALALGLCGLVAVWQALGPARPALWRVLAAALLGLALIVNPLLGAPWIGIAALAALLGGRRLSERLDLPLALALGSLPGLYLLQLAAQEFSGPPVRFVASAERLLRTLLPVWPLLLPLPFAARAAWRDRQRLGAARLWLLLGLALGPLLAALLCTLPYENEYKFVRASAWILALPAALGVAELGRRGAAGRAAGLLLSAFLALGAALNLSFGLHAYLGLAQSELPLEERPLALLPRADGDYHAAFDAELGADGAAAIESDARTRRAAYEFLRGDARIRRANPCLVVDVARPVGGVWGLPGGRLQRFVEPLNLQGHEAAAFAALDLYVDRPSQALDARAPGAQGRLEWVSARFDAGAPWGEEVPRALAELGRPLVLLLGEAERRRDPKLRARLEQFGFAPIWSAGGALLLAWPAAFAAEFPDLGEPAREPSGG
jgi:hypothetical protein